MRRLVLILGTLLIAGVAIAYAGPDMLSLADASCEYQVLEIDGEQFRTLDNVKQAADANGASFDELNRRFDFRDPVDGPVEFKATDCGVEEVSPGQ